MLFCSNTWFFYLDCPNIKANVHLLLSGPISRQSAPPLRRLTSQFSYHNRVVTSWPAVITAASSNQPSKALIKSPGKKTGCWNRGDIRFMYVCICSVHTGLCVYVFHHVPILRRTKRFYIDKKKKWKTPTYVRMFFFSFQVLYLGFKLQGLD